MLAHGAPGTEQLPPMRGMFSRWRQAGNKGEERLDLARFEGEPGHCRMTSDDALGQSLSQIVDGVSLGQISGTAAPAPLDCHWCRRSRGTARKAFELSLGPALVAMIDPARDFPTRPWLLAQNIHGPFEMS